MQFLKIEIIKHDYVGMAHKVKFFNWWQIVH
jgi:hypothetical protein